MSAATHAPLPEPRALTAALARLSAGPALLAATADEQGVWLVGGAVRELLLGGSPIDLDLVVEGDAVDAAARIAARIGATVVAAHHRFGTASLAAPGLSADVATARRERYPTPGALPEVQPASLAEDLARRDFTTNAIAIALWQARCGELEAFPGALADLHARLLRILHPRSFVDDPTRLLRLVRYQARLGFAIEPGTEGLARAAIAAGALRTVSGERIGAELRLLGREPDAPIALQRCGELGLDRALGPDARARPELAAGALALLPPDGRADLLVIATLVEGAGRPAVERFAGALGLSAAERKVVGEAARARALAATLARARKPSELVEAVAASAPETVALAGALGADHAARTWLQDVRHVALEISGHDLLAAGVSEGPEIARALRAALVAKLDHGADGRQAQLAAALRALGRG